MTKDIETNSNKLLKFFLKGKKPKYLKSGDDVLLNQEQLVRRILEVLKSIDKTAFGILVSIWCCMVLWIVRMALSD